MNGIDQVDPAGLSLVAGAGAILADVQSAAEAAGCRFPLSLGAKGSATIGGLVSTNAGGVQVLRHGTMRALVLGMEAVLPDGSLLDQLSALRKDNSGYDLKQLLIGAEGTLGVVTRVSLKLAPALSETAVGWAGLSGPEAALELLQRLRAAAGETVESFELISAEALQLVLANIADARWPLSGTHRFHVLVELGGSPAILEQVMGESIEAGIVEDAVVAVSGGQAAASGRCANRYRKPRGAKAARSRTIFRSQSPTCRPSMPRQRRCSRRCCPAAGRLFSGILATGTFTGTSGRLPVWALNGLPRKGLPRAGRCMI
jgi:FAD/FMN-containing dehydrogenase